MAPSIRRHCGEATGKRSDANRSSSPSKLHRFCKVMVNPQYDRIYIPMELARRYGAGLPKRAHLRAPIGPEFEVELISSNGETWLHKGWDDFKRYYSLTFAHVLVFQYDAESHQLDVLIFDTTGSEIDYPSHDRANGVKEEYISHDDDGGPILKQPFRVKVKTLDESFDDQIESKVPAGELQRNPRKRRKGEQTIDKNTSAAYQRAKANFKSANPHFISLMQPSYFSGVSILAIPASFVKTHMPGKSNKIKLRNRDGKEWAVKCGIQEPNGRISCGWNQFVEDNGLKAGDACVFEISETRKFVWNVTIFPS